MVSTEWDLCGVFRTYIIGPYSFFGDYFLPELQRRRINFNTVCGFSKMGQLTIHQEKQ